MERFILFDGLKIISAHFRWDTSICAHFGTLNTINDEGIECIYLASICWYHVPPFNKDTQFVEIYWSSLQSIISSYHSKKHSILLSPIDFEMELIGLWHTHIYLYYLLTLTYNNIHIEQPDFDSTHPNPYHWCVCVCENWLGNQLFPVEQFSANSI